MHAMNTASRYTAAVSSSRPGLAAIDLNVLVALDALLSERNVTRAAARVGRSQPAMSHALNRARELFHDPLLVRVRGGLEPTARARVVGPQIHRLLRELAVVVDVRKAFDPSTVESITVGATDYVGLLVLPRLVALLREASPGLGIKVRALEGPDALQPLMDGMVDVAVGTFPHVAAGLRMETLFQDDFVCLRRRGHPSSKEKMTSARFAQLDHVLVVSPAAGQGPVDYALAREGKSRHVAAYVPHFLVAPGIVAGTDLVLTTGRRIAEHFTATLPLQVFAPPLRLDPFDVRMLWHARSEKDSVCIWLRDRLRDATAHLRGAQMKSGGSSASSSMSAKRSKSTSTSSSLSPPVAPRT
jgi:DNA-binding transcriptional LysR family regulator